MDELAVQDAGALRGRRQEPQDDDDLQLVVKRKPEAEMETVSTFSSPIGFHWRPMRVEHALLPQSAALNGEELKAKKKSRGKNRFDDRRRQLESKHIE